MYKSSVGFSMRRPSQFPELINDRDLQFRSAGASHCWLMDEKTQAVCVCVCVCVADHTAEDREQSLRERLSRKRRHGVASHVPNAEVRPNLPQSHTITQSHTIIINYTHTNQSFRRVTQTILNFQV